MANVAEVDRLLGDERAPFSSGRRSAATRSAGDMNASGPHDGFAENGWIVADHPMSTPTGRPCTWP